MGCCSTKTAVVDISASGERGGKRPTLAQLKARHLRSEDDSAPGSGAAFGADRNTNPHLRSGADCLSIMEDHAILVVVRVRPLNDREKVAKSTECLQYEGPSDLKIKCGDKDHSFAYDCIMRMDVGQQDMFDRSARPLLHKVLEGYNGCLFAYGQTGSGKTWTMQGMSEPLELRGVIPLLCDELFKEVERRATKKEIRIMLSSLEIYNEHLNDLLSLTNGKTDLQIREEGALGGRGIFVDGLSEHPVHTAKDVHTLIEKGQARRAVGQTNMNEHSSRSHAVITFRINIRDVEDTQGVSEVSSKLHLIDLAGSERQKSTGATGDRLKEGAQINLSLSALGNVINALTEPKSKGKTSGGSHIPYRDSKLTRLLQDSLGGNSFTVMICNVSPAAINSEETLSSLRFAERAKKVKNKAVVNMDPKASAIAKLMEENKLLRAKLDSLDPYVSDLERYY